MDNSIKQLEDVRSAIRVNIESIKSLLDQANSLNEVIASVEDNELHTKLANALNGLYQTIDVLIQNTDNLFDELKEYAATTGTVS